VKNIDFKGREAEFWEHVSVGEADACWPWAKSRNCWGYGNAGYDGHRSNASRVAWIVQNGAIPPGMVVCHSCDNPACCNPVHLFLGSQAENLRDCRRKGRARGVPSGADHPRYVAILTEQMVIEARKLYRSGMRQAEIATRMGVHSSTISRVVRGKRWAHLGGAV